MYRSSKGLLLLAVVVLISAVLMSPSVLAKPPIPDPPPIPVEPESLPVDPENLPIEALACAPCAVIAAVAGVIATAIMVADKVQENWTSCWANAGSGVYQEYYGYWVATAGGGGGCEDPTGVFAQGSFYQGGSGYASESCSHCEGFNWSWESRPAVGMTCYQGQGYGSFSDGHPREDYRLSPCAWVT